ncbi:hypothetical protein WNY78_04245 [Psychroserpens sp. AS72]|uniref:hypothetical protein n=1 Tax=Psychroserpens sp. AS72 TaxID=3135775 RepID=UPI0031784DE9
MKKILIVLAALVLTSCGNDDDSPSCNVVDSVANITIDGNEIQFVKYGYGLHLLPSGRHELDFFYNSVDDSAGYHSYLKITILFKDTGENVITQLIYNSDAVIIFSEGDFSSQVISNNPYCFEANFSGSIQTDEGLLTISEGYASFVYDEPLEDYSIGRLNN